MKTILSLAAAALLALLLSGCGTRGKGKEYYQRRPFPAVQLPMAITDEAARIDYHLTHFWDKYLDTTVTYFTDTLCVNGVHRMELTQNAVMYSTVVARASESKGLKSLERLFDRIEAFERADSSAHMFENMTSLLTEIFYGVDSPYRNENKYAYIAGRLAESEFTPENMRAAYRNDCRMCSLNREGTRASDFVYMDRHGRRHTLLGTPAKYLLLVFLNPGCHACKEVLEALDDPDVIRLMESGDLKVMGMYIDPDIKAWKEGLSALPEGWLDGYDPDGIIRRDIVYNVRAIPSLYLLDSEKTIMMKDAPVENVRTAIDNIIKLKNNAMTIKQDLWGKTPDGKEIYKYVMTNATGASVTLSSIGAGIVAVNVPDRDGILGDVVIGYDDPMSYFDDGPCAGKCPGRYANRIALGKFTLDGVEYTLPINNGPNHLHGGPQGFQNQVWDSRIEGNAVEFQYVSKDGEMGYPGNLKVVAHYEWNEKNELLLSFTAETDKATIINLTNHTYFNLNGEGSGTVKDHLLKLNASEFLTTSDSLIPEGESTPVAGTPMDFTVAKPIGRDMFADFTPLKYGKGYDHCFVIDGAQKGQLQTAAVLYSEKTGRMVEVVTTQPGVQIYAGCWLEGCPVGKKGHLYHDYDAVAIECQHFPDSPNHPDYPSTVLRPGETFQEAIIFAFSVK